MSRGLRQFAMGAGGTLLVLLVVAVVALVVVANTDWGRERVRSLAVEALNEGIEGEARVGAVEGNLLGRIRLVDVEIVDEDGELFVEAARLSTRPSLLSLLRQRVILRDTQLDDAVVLLDKPPGKEWNFARIFLDADPDPDRPESRWGRWIDLRGLTLIDSRVEVRSEWTPSDDLSPAERVEAIRQALSPESRTHVVEVPGGYQTVMIFRRLNAALSRVVVAHPRVDGISIDVERMSGAMEPFRPPAAFVRDLSGTFLLRNDSLLFRDVAAVMPGSQISGEGAYDLDDGELVLRLEGAPVALNDLRWLHPALPTEGGGDLRFLLDQGGKGTRIAADRIDVAVRGGTISGRFDATFGDTLRLGVTDLAFERVDTRLIDEIIPGWESPRAGLLTGNVQLAGTDAAIDVDADIRFDDFAAPASRVRATGQVRPEPDLAFSDLVVRVDPLRAELVRAFAPDLPVAGAFEGFVRLTGSPSGILDLDGDVTLRDPSVGVSRVSATGGVDLRDDLLLRDLHVRLDPLQLDALRGEVPDLPAGATARGEVRLDGDPSGLLRLDGHMAVSDPRSGLSRVAAVGAIDTRRELRLHDLRLTFDPLQLDLIRGEVPELPPGATVAGRARVDGVPARSIVLDADLAIDDPATGTSRVAARGGVVVTEPRLRDLQLRLEPLQLDLVRHVDPDFPIGGELTGTAALDGWFDTGLGFVADLTHQEAGEVSHVSGRGHLATGEPTAPIEVDLHLQPLSLRTVGQLAPEAGLRGRVGGTVQAAGTLEDFRVHASLAVADTGSIFLDGRFDLAADEPRYAADLRLVDLNLASVTAHAPAHTALTGAIEAAGEGVDPETMDATLAADLTGSRLGDVEVDTVHVRASVADGLLRLQPLLASVATAQLEAEGSFGLVPERSGVLAYRLEADSLEAFARWMPPADTAEVAARPEATEAALEAERAAWIEAIATGEPPRLAARADTLEAPAPPDTRLAGSVHAEGTLTGNVERFDVEGTAEVEDLIVGDSFVESGRARYAIAGVGTADLEGDVVASTGAIRVEGFAFDSTAVELSYAGARFGAGQLTLVAHQDEDSDIAAHLDFVLSLERNEVTMTDIAFRFGEVTWVEAQPATIAWGDPGVEVESLELLSDDGARIYIHGRLPVEGIADLELEIDRLRVEHILTLLQEDAAIEGSISARATVEGAAEAPVMEGQAVLENVLYEGRAMPRAAATFAYAERELEVRVELQEAGRSVAVAEAVVPAELSLVGDQGPGILDGPLQVDVHGDEIPLELVHLFTDDVRVEHGLAAGRISVRGTTTDPELQGDLTLSATRVEVVPMGVRFERVRGGFSLVDDRVVVDSLVAWSHGPVRASGAIDVSDPSAPGFDLTLEAREAWLIDTDDANLLVDADLTIEGPFDAVEVAGTVRLRRGVIYIPELMDADGEDPIDLEDPDVFARVDDRLRERRDALITPSPFLENLTVNVEVHVERDVWLRSTEANVEIYTPPEIGPLAVRMSGFTNGPVLEGTVNSDRGQYEFMSRRLDVTRAAVTFDGEEGFNPFVQLVAEHEVRPPGHEPLNIRVVLTGLADDLELNVESDAEPPIPETDLMAYFVFGRDASSLLGHHGSTLAGQGAAGAGLLGDVTTVATQQLAGVFVDAVIGGFEAETARALGLDVFRVSTVDIPTEILSGRAEDILRSTEFEAGSYVTPRIFLAGQVRPTFVHPGLLFEYGTPGGFQWIVTLRPRYLTPEPTLEEQEPERTSVLGALLRRVWRF